MPSNTVLPDGINESLPAQAIQLEALRRGLLDEYQSWGYHLVIPPMVEYLESLRTGLGNQLDIETFKITDQLNGRLMGIRADMTPQVARIDASRIAQHDATLINRLCYIGSVLRTRSVQQGGSRAPIQVGAELFGHAGIESDFEIITLMLKTLQHVDKTAYVLDLGHVSIAEGVAAYAGLDEQQKTAYFDKLSRKSIPEIEAFVADLSVDEGIRKVLRALPDLHGGVEVLDSAKTQFANTNETVLNAIDYLQSLASCLQHQYPELDVHMDLAELRGYAYHTGIVYALYHPGQRDAIARGGRYDGIGERFGNARPATGFSTDLRTLLAIARQNDTYQFEQSEIIYAPFNDDAALQALIDDLRAQGKCVIRQFEQQVHSEMAQHTVEIKKNTQDEWVLSR